RKKGVSSVGERGSRDLRFAIIGSGMAGILSAVKLEEEGLTDFTVYEKADRVGGTWRENTYPGLSCDVPSHLYCYSFARNPDWSHFFSPGYEIQAYFERVVDEYKLAPHIRFGDEVVSCSFDDGRWKISTRSGHRDEVDVVIAATGVLHHPKYPDIEGLECFEGALFHSARWDHDVLLEGARVGIIGTGSTSVQIVSAIVDRVQQLSLFQRTAQWIMPATNPEYDASEKRSFRENPQLIADLRAATSQLYDMFSSAVVDAGSAQIKGIEEACKANLVNSVVDPALRERLRPDYRAACKRLIVSTDFYEAIQKPNAELVTEPIEAVETKGVRTTDGVLRELDVLVLATGFAVDAFVRPMSVEGRNGVKLDDVWADRPEAYLSISVPDFPNFFMLNGPNGPVGNFSLVEVAELQVGYIMSLVDRLRSGECREIAPTEAALREFESARVQAAKKTVWASGCRSWYLDDRGVPAVWPWPFERFRVEMSTPDWTAYEFCG
ncbi:MAG TPA: NAD(P)/FAD-dependent oxidoreductase, partial [Acidimicrobiales bacterium]|nr:NAD(P)/FAD-dependent oxidoreductase [Acidimicrobiales bacterium]